MYSLILLSCPGAAFITNVSLHVCYLNSGPPITKIVQPWFGPFLLALGHFLFPPSARRMGHT